MMDYKIATEVGQSYNRRDDESTDTLGDLCRGLIAKRNSSHKHPEPKSQQSRDSHEGRNRTLGNRALTRAPLSDNAQEESSGWWPKLGKGKDGYAPLVEIDLTDIATSSNSTHSAARLTEPDPYRHSHSHSHSPDYTHPHSHPDDHHHSDDHRHSHDYAHDDEGDHEHHHGNHSPTRQELQSLLPEGVTRFMTAISGSIKKRVVSAFQPPEDPCAPGTSLGCLLWDCVHTIAGGKGGDVDHHVHTEQYRSHAPSVPPLPSMADWANRCPASCLNDDGTVCTEEYHGDATRGHSHM
jgi:hypothetical protein